MKEVLNIQQTSITTDEIEILTEISEKFVSFEKLSSILLKDSFNVSLYNLVGASYALVISKLIKGIKNAYIITNSDNEAQKVFANLNELLPKKYKEKIFLFPDLNIVPYEKISPSIELLGEQMNVLLSIVSSEKNVIITTTRALFNPIINKDEFKKNILKLSINTELNLSDFKEKLLSFGYSPETTVERVGDISFRGGIVDVFSPSNRFPIRIEFRGNVISSIRFFDPSTQLSIGKVQIIEMLPVSHLILDRDKSNEIIKNVEEFNRKNEIFLSNVLAEDIEKIKNLSRFSGIDHYLPFSRNVESTLLSYIGAEDTVFMINSSNVKEAIKTLKSEANEIYEIERKKKEIFPLNFNKYLNDNEKKLLGIKKIVNLESSPLSDGDENNFAIPLKASESLYSSDFKGIINSYLNNKGTVFIASKQKNRVVEILNGYGFDLSGKFLIVRDMYLSEGFSLTDNSFTLLTDKELFGWKGVHKHFKRFKESVPIKSVEDLKEGDILVHYNYGIGIYRGLVVVPDAEGNNKEYLLMEYAKGDKLYVPPERINMVNKYVGDAESISLSRLGGAEWDRVKERVKKGTKELAEELLKLYAKREISSGYEFSKDTTWQHELELSFPYEETPDQLNAINDVKNDMEKKKIMDRIVTGDVGYGKTEVAIRSAFKAIMDGFQVALLVPTTILANQHYETFKERYAPFPIEIALLSRLVSEKYQEETIKKIKEGKVDLVIGTHKLLSSKVEFKKLGLLIIDEEHKFGVKQKERIKKLKEDVDVLTLTATPIPRTLSMAISGIREISQINTSPEGRKPVKTYVMPYDSEIVKDAVKFELSRGGQVYYVHNRIKDIERVEEELKKILVDVKIGVVHGRSSEDELDRVMTSFLKGDIDVLLCTTIIESGIDIPTVNTLIVDDSDKLGLAQLYQLRGRVGRSNKRAYAYFLYPTSKPLTKEAILRLDAIKNFVELGSGLNVALRDLEIRGAGNFLGPEQHGNIRTVGYHLYVQLLKETIDELKRGNGKKERDLPEFPLSGYIPYTYLKDDGERLSAYQELVSVRSIKELRKLEDEYTDKYGKTPEDLMKFYNNLELRIIAFEKGLSGIKYGEGLIFFNFDNETLNIKVENISKLVKKFGNKIRFKTDAIILRKDDLEFNDAVREVMECL